MIVQAPLGLKFKHAMQDPVATHSERIVASILHRCHQCHKSQAKGGFYHGVNHGVNVSHLRP